jgi:hypothetical protein
MRLSPILVLALASSISAATFDWRSFPGSSTLPAGNYITPVKDQGPYGTCAAFADIAEAESSILMGTARPGMVLDLSEMQLREPLDLRLGKAIVSAALCAYPQGAPAWPLPGVFTAWVPGSIITAEPGYLDWRAALTTLGPLEVNISAEHDWYNPATGATAGAFGGVDHKVQMVGMTDDPSAPGGGYVIVKNSWGTGWGDAGYGDISYARITQDAAYAWPSVVDLAYGTPQLVTVPEPSSLTMVCLLMAGLLRRRR